MPEDWQSKCSFSNEDITGHNFKGLAGWIRRPFIVTGSNQALTFKINYYLRTAMISNVCGVAITCLWPDLA